MKKGIDRLEKQVLQYIGVFISKDLVDITLVKKCQTTDIPALNIAVGKMQKSLKRYVGFEDIDVNNCNKIENLMDKAQIWAMDVEEVYNKAEIYSINTTKGDYLDVGIFCHNATVTVFEFLEAAELAY